MVPFSRIKANLSIFLKNARSYRRDDSRLLADGDEHADSRLVGAACSVVGTRVHGHPARRHPRRRCCSGELPRGVTVCAQTERLRCLPVFVWPTAYCEMLADIARLVLCALKIRSHSLRRRALPSLMP